RVAVVVAVAPAVPDPAGVAAAVDPAGRADANGAAAGVHTAGTGRDGPASVVNPTIRSDAGGANTGRAPRIHLRGHQQDGQHGHHRQRDHLVQHRSLLHTWYAFSEVHQELPGLQTRRLAQSAAVQYPLGAFGESKRRTTLPISSRVTVQVTLRSH